MLNLGFNHSRKEICICNDRIACVFASCTCGRDPTQKGRRLALAIVVLHSCDVGGHRSSPT